jgi:Protein of unknown function (DUF2892)
MTDSRFDNVNPLERLIRLAAGGVLIAVIFYPGVTAFWLALVAVYPIMTAIMAWDPLYALLGNVKLQMPFNRETEIQVPA